MPGRNGCYMQPQLVTDYLKRLGGGAIGQQLNVCVQKPVASHLSHAEMDGINQQQARYGCKQMGLAARGTLPELKLRLKEHFK